MSRRPVFHFTPEKGWINDPNGTIYINGEYHLFYQHYPDHIIWGPMHWGHATSRDLINWEHKEIALYPDDDGYIFSGSCVYDVDNVSGLGVDGKCPLIAVYTCHEPQKGYQQQCIAYSLDFQHFTKYQGNPVIANNPEKCGDNYLTDFRDPKVFKNPVRKGYSMVLSGGRVLYFYYSEDLIHWERTGEFNPGKNGFYGICECPDCFCLDVDGTGEKKWVLTLSSILENEKIGGLVSDKGFGTSKVMQYFVGDFDGDTFIDTEQYGMPLVIDYGPDNYAMVTFADSPVPLGIGWGENWDYVSECEAPENGKYRGKMTLPRRLRLVKTESGYRLSQEPYLENMIDDKCICASYTLGEGERLELGRLVIELEDDSLIVSRLDYLKERPDNYRVFMAKRTGRREKITNNTCKILVTEDQGYYEIFADDGLIAFSIMT